VSNGLSTCMVRPTAVGLQDSSDHIGRGPACGQADGPDDATVTFHQVTPDNIRCVPVSPLDKNIRKQLSDKPCRRVFTEQADEVYCPER